jgi:hypothetical protein
MIVQSHATHSSTFNPEKWLGMLQRWRPRMPQAELIDFMKGLMEAAGPQRLEGLDALFIHVDSTTRSKREKFEKLRGWSRKMRSDPRFWPQLFERSRPVSELIKKILDQSKRALKTAEVERTFRRYRKVPPTGLAQELGDLARRREIDRHGFDLYWRKGTAPEPWESIERRAFRLVFSAPDHRIREADLAIALGLMRKETATLVSHSRKRGRFAPATGDGVVAVSAESLAALQDGPILDGRGAIFFAVPERAAPLDRAVFTTLHPDRPRVDPNEYVADIARMAMLSDEQLAPELGAAAKRWGRSEEEILGLVRELRAQRVIAAAALPAPVPEQAALSSAERKAIEKSGLKECEEQYYQLIKAHPDRRGQKSSDVLELEMMNDLALSRNQVRSCRATAIKRYEAETGKRCKWGRSGIAGKIG